jgi:general stress protein 26
MTKEEVFEFIKKNPVFALATAEDNKPHVRNMMKYASTTPTRADRSEFQAPSRRSKI